jgi:hypothetical protein
MMQRNLLVIPTNRKNGAPELESRKLCKNRKYNPGIDMTTSELLAIIFFSKVEDQELFRMKNCRRASGFFYGSVYTFFGRLLRSFSRFKCLVTCHYQLIHNSVN